MASIRYKKRGNKWYVYKITYHWDKEHKRGRQTSEYLGNAPTEGGEYAKTGRKNTAKPKLEKAIVDFGDSFAINEIGKAIGLNQVVADSFGNLADSIINLACFQIIEGAAMQSAEDWYEGNIARFLFKTAKIKSQDISRLIDDLGKQEFQQRFFKAYVAKFFPGKTGLLIDSTALPSAINASVNAYGHTADGIKENITALMLVEKTTKLPIYFRAIGGDIADISTLKTTIAEIKELGLKTESAILDAGFCSKENLQFMCAQEVSFVTRLPKSQNIFFDLADKLQVTESLEKLVQYGDRVVFIESQEVTVYGDNMFSHLILYLSKKYKDVNMAMKDKMGDKHTPAQIAELDKKLRYSGLLILLSKAAMEKDEILPTYYTRQAIEQIFGFAKSNNNLLPLRVHSERSINGYLMLVFLSLILFISLREKLKSTMTMDQALLRLRGLKAKIYENQIIVQEPSKKVKDIAKLLNIILPTSLGV
jgi:transposase